MRADRLHEMLTEAEAELNTAETTVLHLRQVVDGLRGLLAAQQNGKLAEVTTNTGLAATSTVEVKQSTAVHLKPVEAVRRALSEHPNRPLTFREIWAIIEQRGWVIPGYKAYRNATDAAARRLAADEDSPIKKLADSRYVHSAAISDGKGDSPVGTLTLGEEEVAP